MCWDIGSSPSTGTLQQGARSNEKEDWQQQSRKKLWRAHGGGRRTWTVSDYQKGQRWQICMGSRARGDKESFRRLWGLEGKNAPNIQEFPGDLKRSLKICVEFGNYFWLKSLWFFFNFFLSTFLRHLCNKAFQFSFWNDFFFSSLTQRKRVNVKKQSKNETEYFISGPRNSLGLTKASEHQFWFTLSWILQFFSLVAESSSLFLSLSWM